MAKHRKPHDLVMGAGRHSRVWLILHEKPPTPGYVRKHGQAGDGRKVLLLRPVR